jgi:2-polyprenyl-3-methyl-5-hydroxy-6-metoxy-1,4-benzoquinol methylase
VPSDLASCKVCSASALDEIAEFRLLPRVTSDCVPFRDGGRLLICASCGATQSPADQQWFDEIGEIYNAYRSFQQYGGPEQHVLDATTGKLRRRSEVLLDCLSALPNFPQKGAVLDVGCGGGATLRGFAERGGWSLFGLELDDRDLHLLNSITGFDTLYTGPPRDLPRKFDAITMVHSLEHFPEPSRVLRELSGKIACGGRLFVEVPDAAANPFEYLVADHMVHFTAPTLARLACHSGFAVECLSTRWVSKEISLTAQPGDGEIPSVDHSRVAEAIAYVRAQITWLLRFIDAARQAASASPRFGLFGSTIAATWLCGVLGDSVSFFVEEDTNRVGRTHLERPVLSPAQVPHGSVVYMSLIPRIANQVAARLTNSIELRLPPSEEL